MAAEPSDPAVVTDGVVTLRPMMLVDAEAHLAGEDDEQRRWLWNDVTLASALPGVIAYIERCQQEWATGASRRAWGIREAATDVLVGSVEAYVRQDGAANVSVAVYPEFRRRGYAARAVRMASVFAHEVLGVERAVAIIDTENIASRRTAERVGFVLDGLAELWEDTVPSGVMLRYFLTFE